MHMKNKPESTPCTHVDITQDWFLNGLLRSPDLPHKVLLPHGKTVPCTQCVSVPTMTVCCDCSPRLVVGAPLEVVAVNQTGQLYDCAPATGVCRPILLHSE